MGKLVDRIRSYIKKDIEINLNEPTIADVIEDKKEVKKRIIDRVNRTKNKIKSFVNKVLV